MKTRTASMLLAALILISFRFIADAETGGMNTDTARISIITRYYGVTAEEIEKNITIPMEEAVSGIAGIEELKSGSEFSLSRIDLRLSPSTDIGQFMIEARERIERSYAWISQQNPAVQKPRIFSSGSDQQAVFIAAFSDGNLGPEELRPLVENEIEPSYSRIEGLGEIEIVGGSLPEIHVNVDTDRAAAFGYSSDSIASLIRDSNIYSTAGVIDNGKTRLPLSIEARIGSLSELRSLPVAQAVRLNDIAAANFSYREADNISRLNGTERVSLHIKSSSNNLISISRHLRAETEEWTNRGWEAEVVYDRGAELENAFRRIAVALGIGMLVSSALLMLFRVDNRRLLTLFITQPLILLFSIGLLAAAGFSPDRWLLAGLTVGIGMILDSALLTTDSLHRTAGRFVPIRPLFSSTLSTLAALLPVISLTSEIPGLRQLIAALAVMLSVSLVISLVFIPPFYRPHPAGAPGGFIFLLAKLRRSLLSISAGAVSASGSIRKHRIILGSSALIPLAGIICLTILPIQLNTPADSPVIFARVELPEGESMESSDAGIKKLCEDIEAGEYIISVQSTSRRSGGDLAIRFDDKKISRDAMIAVIKSLGNTVPGGFIYIPEGDHSNLLKLTISVTGAETERLKKISRETLGCILENNWAVEGVLHFKDDPPAVHYIPDSKALAAAGITAASAASFLHWNLQGPVADKWYFTGKERDLRVMATGYTGLDTAGLGALKIPGSASNSASRLDQLGTFIKTTDSARINRLNRQHTESFTVSCTKTNPVKLNTKIWAELDKIKLPSGYSFIPSSRLIERQQLYRRMWLRFILAVVLIFFMLSIERESLKQAGMILIQLPYIIAVPLLTVKLSGLELGTETIFGLILVSGMGINNGILIMDNMSDGVFLAVKQRFNGLFLTTVTSVGGLVPMLFTNDPFFRNLAIVLVSGLTASFFISLWLFPVFLAAGGRKV